MAKATGLRSGTLYPILSALLKEGWLVDGWEQVDPVVAKRPPRRYYRLTATGLRELGAVVQRAEMEAASRRGYAGPGVATA